MRGTGSGGTELDDYGSDLESYTPECYIYVTILNEQAQDALIRHDPNETSDQISKDDPIANAPLDEDEAR